MVTSYNGLVKIDYQINSKNTLSFHYFAWARKSGGAG